MTEIKCDEKLSWHFAEQGGILIRPKGWEQKDSLYCALIEGYAFVYYREHLAIYAPDEFDIIGMERNNEN